ncbi:hypothetical protein [Neorhizobium petrolearium]|uniref:hypothetical protein n=1 Tax=Neorhizobium petrolearium TaxID=515361 RepID=UPI003F7FF86C
MKRPTEGGRYVRDPETKQLKPATNDEAKAKAKSPAPAEASSPEPQTRTPVAGEKGK